VGLQRHRLRLLEQALHHHVERDVAAPSDVVVSSDVLLVDPEGRRRPHGTCEPHRFHVVEQFTENLAYFALFEV